VQPDDFVPFCIIRVIYERLSRLSTLPAHSGGRAGAPLPIRRSPGPHVSLSHPRPGVPAASGGRAGPESREPSAGRERAAGEVRGCLGSCHNIGFLVLFFFCFFVFCFFVLFPTKLFFFVCLFCFDTVSGGRAAVAVRPRPRPHHHPSPGDIYLFIYVLRNDDGDVNNDGDGNKGSAGGSFPHTEPSAAALRVLVTPRGTVFPHLRRTDPGIGTGTEAGTGIRPSPPVGTALRQSKARGAGNSSPDTPPIWRKPGDLLAKPQPGGEGRRQIMFPSEKQPGSAR